MNLIFTIVSKNYIGLAEALQYSVTDWSDIEYYVLIVDDIIESEIDLKNNYLNARSVLNIGDALWEQMAFKYDLVEFCTSIKAAAFQYFFEKGYANVVYFDPDIYLFNSPDLIFKELDSVDILLTPHIVDPEFSANLAYPDNLFLLNGTFNLGFLGLHKSDLTLQFLRWWHQHLISFTFFDNDMGTATDQKWVNLVPALFPEGRFRIIRSRGYNMAPWNFHERKIIIENNQFFVGPRNEAPATIVPLVFVHFSGFDYLSFSSGLYKHKNEQLSKYPDLLDIYQKYAEALQNSTLKTFLSLKYSYNYYKNGKIILHLHRRLFRSLLESGKNYENPFACGKGTFYELMDSARMIDDQHISADKITNKSVKGFNKKLKIVHILFKLIKSIIGIRYYSILIRFLRRFCVEENQVFLVTNELSNKIY